MRLDKKGFTLIELLVALGISSIVSIGVIKETRNIKKKEITIQELRKNKILKIKINNMVNPYLNKHGNWSAFKSYRITNKNEFLEHDAISIINFITESYLVKTKDEYCPRGIALKQRKFPALIFNKDFWTEAEIELRKKGDCYNLEKFKTYPSPFNSDKIEEDKNIDLDKDTILLPIYSSFSVFLDNENTLRKINHKNNHHQPIAYNVNKFKLYENKIELENNEIITLKYPEKTSNPLELFAILYNTDLNQ